MKICWLIDDPGWAMGVSLKRISSRSEHEHVYVTVDELSEYPVVLEDVEADLYICTFPPWLRCFKSLKNVVACLKSKRAFE
jgi:hypothetical protein